MKDQLIRFVLGLMRPSKCSNLKLMAQRGETTDSFLIRKANSTDIPALAELHVQAWNETYPFVKRPPSLELRTYQWQEKFKKEEEKWCCFLVEDENKQLIGFAMAIAYSGTLNFDGELNKIYLLRKYQRLGLGHRLVQAVVQWLLEEGFGSMVLFSEVSNPSIRFYEALKGERIYVANGQFHGAYGWSKLKELAAMVRPNDA